MTANNPPPMTWDIDIALLTNPYMVRSLLKVTLGAAALTGILVSFLLAIQGDWALVAPMLGLFAAAGVGFFLLSLLIMWAVFGNRQPVRFTVSADGVRVESRDRRAKAIARSAVILGLLAGRPGAAGSGLLSMTQENQALAWSGAFRAKADPTRHTIALANRWRILLMVYCTADNFEAVRAQIHERMTSHHTAERARGPSPVPAYLLRTALAVLACLPVFLLADVFDLGLLLPLLLMSFAIASVWFVRHLAWVVLGCAGALAAGMLSGGWALRESSLHRGQTYHRYETLSGDHWALTALAAAGLAYLCWSAIQVLRRRTRPALESDLTDSGGG